MLGSFMFMERTLSQPYIARHIPTAGNVGKCRKNNVGCSWGHSFSKIYSKIYFFLLKIMGVLRQLILLLYSFPPLSGSHVVYNEQRHTHTHTHTHTWMFLKNVIIFYLGVGYGTKKCGIWVLKELMCHHHTTHQFSMLVPHYTVD